MKILLDENLPKQLRRNLPEQEVKTVGEMGWAGFKNGKLLALAEPNFDVFLTMDRNLPFQQSLRNRSIVVIVLVAFDNELPSLLPLMPLVLERLQVVQPGDVLHIGEKSR